MSTVKPDQHEYIPYRGYLIEQRKRYNKKLDGWRTFGFFLGNTIYHSLTEAQFAVDEIVNEQNENRFWDAYAEMNYD